MLFFKPNKYIGIDIGTGSIKLVELKKDGEKVILNTYGELKIAVQKEGGEKMADKADILHMPEKQFSDLLRQLLTASGTTSKHAVFSIPVFSAFITLIDLPSMTEKELADSIPFEARKYIPVPVSEVQFSWSIVERPGETISLPIPGSVSTPMANKMQVLLVAVPNEIIVKYKNIAKNVGLEAEFEIETFSIARSIIKKGISDKEVAIIADIGAKSTEICLIDNGLVRFSHNFEASGGSITRALASGMGVDPEKAEELKMKQGIKSATSERRAIDSILPLIDMILFEIERTNTNYQQKTGRKAQRIILSGGTANLPGLVDYISNHLGVVVSIADPFFGISASPILTPTLREIGPAFSVAVGLAERNLI